RLRGFTSPPRTFWPERILRRRPEHVPVRQWPAPPVPLTQCTGGPENTAMKLTLHAISDASEGTRGRPDPVPTPTPPLRHHHIDTTGTDTAGASTSGRGRGRTGGMAAIWWDRDTLSAKNVQGR